MKDKIIILNASRKIFTDYTIKVIKEIQRIRDLDVQVNKDTMLTNRLMRDKAKGGARGYNGNISIDALQNIIEEENPAFGKDSEAGKIVILDEILYGFFAFEYGNPGVILKVPDCRGFIIATSHKNSGKYRFKDTMRHELGHMFGAPNRERARGHCLVRGCVMGAFVSKTPSHSHYCTRCRNDIANYDWRTANKISS